MSRPLIVPILLLCAACASPLRETTESEQPASPPAAAAKPDAPPAAPVVAPPAETEPASQPDTQPAAPAAPPAKPHAPRALVTPDPLKSVLAAEERRVEHEKLIVRLASERDAAAQVVARREKDLLAFKNPFLPRPQLNPDEAAEIKGLGGAARAQWAERRVADAKALLDAAQKAYDDAQANP